MKTANKKQKLIKAKKKWQYFQKEVKTKMLNSTRQLVELRKRFKNKKLVFTIGAWDLLNEGHANYLLEARKKGDLLVVGVISDQSRQKTKGEGHPVIGEKLRAESLAHFACVDFTVVVENDLIEVLQLLRPDVFYTIVNDWEEGERNPEEEYVVKSQGGKIIKVSKVKPYISSLAMIDQVASVKIRQVVFVTLGKKMGNLILSKKIKKDEI
ncbi:MAG TPA: adenylyltransferase/cytidyltransferase family protein [Clostridia bacterium]|nr:adenylyltransferase/cytidyltransferase family protein [Clostridia bacterium]